jgi:protein SCO1/2
MSSEFASRRPVSVVRKPFDNFFLRRIRSAMESNIGTPGGSQVDVSRRSGLPAQSRRVLGGICALILLSLAGCSRAERNDKPEQKRYALTGEIVSVDVARKVLAVRHDDIPGLMPAMTMEFSVSEGDAAVAKVGQHIRAQLIPADKGDWHLEQIWPAEAVATTTLAAQANALRQDTLTRGKTAYREIGEKIPDFALYDQEGRVVESVRFHGKQIMLNFIFSRCPVANMCPASTMKMMSAQKLAREAGVKNLELVSITLDPAYDTPGVLRQYALARGIDTTNFSFLTGPENAIKDLLVQFGVIAEFQGDLLKHTLTTLLINENGQIAHRVDGSSWEPAEFVGKMKR